MIPHPMLNKNNDRPKEFSPMEYDDPGKWELDPEPYLNKVYHNLLGEVEDKDGNWVKDPRKNRVMNELGASEFVNDLTIFSIHTHFSELQDEDIVDIASRAAEIYGNKMVDKYEEWDIEPIFSNMESIAQRLFVSLKILLKIARNGGMKKHREKSRGGYFGQQRENTEEGII